MNKYERYRLKDLEGYRARKRGQAKKDRAKRTAYARLWREKNREKHNAQAKASHHRNKHRHALKRKANYYAKTYGLSLEALEAMNEEQGGACAICHTVRKLHVDHDHKTGSVRGLLCYPCNTRLGWFDKFAQDIAAHVTKKSGQVW